MSKRPRRNHAPGFKAKVALEALKGEQEQKIVELSQRFQVHPNQITEWKKQLLEHAPEIFSKDRRPDQFPSVQDLHAKIGQLSMEHDFLSGALGLTAFRPYSIVWLPPFPACPMETLI